MEEAIRLTVGASELDGQDSGVRGDGRWML